MRPCSSLVNLIAPALTGAVSLKRATLFAAVSIFNGPLAAEEPAKPLPGGPLAETASRGVTARDPSTIVKEGDTYWCFYTGKGTPSLQSKDLVTWKPGPRVFEKAPEWISKEVPKNDGVLATAAVLAIEKCSET